MTRLGELPSLDALALGPEEHHAVTVFLSPGLRRLSRADAAQHVHAWERRRGLDGHHLHAGGQFEGGNGGKHGALSPRVHLSQDENESPTNGG